MKLTVPQRSMKRKPSHLVMKVPELQELRFIFLLTFEEHSKFHKLTSDEIWHFHLGGAARIHIISPSGILTEETIGSDFDKGEKLQVIIKRGHWFAAEISRGDYILVGCTVSPGFEFEDFQLADRDQLIKEFPEHSGLISRLT